MLQQEITSINFNAASVQGTMSAFNCLAGWVMWCDESPADKIYLLEWTTHSPSNIRSRQTPNSSISFLISFTQASHTDRSSHLVFIHILSTQTCHVYTHSGHAQILMILMPKTVWNVSCKPRSVVYNIIFFFQICNSECFYFLQNESDIWKWFAVIIEFWLNNVVVCGQMVRTTLKAAKRGTIFTS